MAGDWIKYRADLATHPKFLAICSALMYPDPEADPPDWLGLHKYTCGDNLGIDAMPPMNSQQAVTAVYDHVTEPALRDVTMMSLLRVWCAVNAHCKVEGDDAIMAPMCIEDIDAIAGFLGFGEAMKGAGWLAERSHKCLVFPHFLEFNSPARFRLVPKSNAERQSAYRARKKAVTDSNGSNGREEKRRVTKEPLPLERGCVADATKGSGRPGRDSALASVRAVFGIKPDERAAAIEALHPDIQAAAESAGGFHALGQMNDFEFGRAFRAAYRRPRGRSSNGHTINGSSGGQHS